MARLEQVHRRRRAAQLSEVKPVMEKQISTVRFDSACTKVPVEKQQYCISLKCSQLIPNQGTG